MALPRRAFPADASAAVRRAVRAVCFARLRDTVGEQQQAVTRSELYERVFVLPIGEHTQDGSAIFHQLYRTRSPLEDRRRVAGRGVLHRSLFSIEHAIEQRYKLLWGKIGAQHRIDRLA